MRAYWPRSTPFSYLFYRAPRPWTARRVPVNGATLRVLVVDDNQDAAFALATCLSVEDTESRAVFGGVEAVDMAREWAPHVLLMDIDAAQCNGYKAARALRDDPRTRGDCNYSHTALDEAEVRRQATGDAFDGYVQKAVHPAS